MINKNMETEKLIVENRRLVVAVAKQYLNLGLTMEQLIVEGNKGLVKASERYDKSNGYKFMAYAVWWIRQSILLALSKNEFGRQNTLSERELSIRKDIEAGRSMTDIAEEWNITERRVQQIYNRSTLKTIKQ